MLAANYRKSLVNFDRVQEAGTGGGGGNAVVSVGSSAASRLGTGSAGATSGTNNTAQSRVPS